MISINPCKFLEANADGVDWDYVNSSWQPNAPDLPPHVYQLASRAYFYLRRTGQDQAIILNGSSGSGKSEARRLIIRALIDAASAPPGKKGSKLAQMIPASQFILSTFGHAGTLSNPDASRFGRYTEIQFGGDKHRLIGIKGLEYHLETSRVAGPPRGERNFHVFYYMLAGVSAEEASHLRLDTGGFAYVGGASYPTRSTEDARKYEQLKQAFKAVSFSKRAVASIHQLLAAILHLGQLTFVFDKSRSTESAVVHNVDVLQHIATLLGVDASALEAALNVRTKTVGWDRVSAFLDVDGASANRDELARVLYRLLFVWLGEHLNERMSKDDFRSFVSIVDFPGSQGVGSSTPNGMNQFCFNLANERSRSFLLHHLFDRQKAEYESEGVASKLPGFDVQYLDNSETSRLLVNRPGGLVHIMDDQAGRPGKTDSTMLEAMGKRWANHPSFGWRAGDEDAGRTGTFVVNHYDGQVTYTADNFLDQNRASVSTDFIHLFAGNETSTAAEMNLSATASRSDTINLIEPTISKGGSQDSFIKELFAKEAAEAAEAQSNGGTLKPKTTLRARPSTRRKRDAAGTLAPPVESALSRKKSTRAGADRRTVAGAFNEALDLLFETLSDVRPF